MLNMDDLVDALEERCFGGQLPPFPNEIVSAVLSCVPCLRDADGRSSQAFADALHLAISQRLKAKKANEEARWLS